MFSGQGPIIPESLHVDVSNTGGGGGEGSVVRIAKSPGWTLKSPENVTTVSVFSTAVTSPDAALSPTRMSMFGGGCGEGGGGNGGGGELGGLFVTDTFTCGIDFRTLFWKRHRVYVPRARDTLIFKSVLTMSAVPSGCGADLHSDPSSTNEATSAGKTWKSPVN